jgi:hypothetical protein
MKYLWAFLFCISTLLGQSVDWTDLMVTDIIVGDNDYDIFTNHYGNHIIVQETNALKYYRMDVTGNTESSSDLETSSVVSPSITGNKDTIYVVYRKSSESAIKVKYSIDGGENWSTLSQTPNSTNASIIESAFSKDNLHITFLEGTTVYYTRKYVFDATSWTTRYPVSSSYSATNPRIAVWNEGSDNKVYVTYNNGVYERWRGLDVSTGTWSNADWYINYGLGFVPLNIGFAVDDTYIYAFQKYSTGSIFSWNVRRISDNLYIGTGNGNNNTNVDKVFTTTIVNGESCVAAWDMLNTPNGIDRMRFDGDEYLVYDLIYNETGLDPVNIVNLSSAENDVHVIWMDNLSEDTLRYKYYDDVPLAPQNLDVTSYTVEGVSHPKLTWSFNNAPDVYINSTGYEIWRRTRESNGTWHEWSMINSVGGDVSEYVDYELSSVWADAYEAEYKIRAKDYNSHYSDYSSVVSITFGHFSKTNAFVTN